MTPTTRRTLRLSLTTAAVLAVMAFASTSVFGQTPTPTADTVPARSKVAILSSLILNHVDFVTITIFVLSIVSLTYIIRGFLQARAEVIAPAPTVARIRELIASRQFQELLDYTDADPSFVSKSLNPALRRAPHFTAMKEAMETALGEQTADAFRRIEILNIIGNLGPLLGLLGTVLGMIEAFDAMYRAGGQANAAQLAGGIATALAHTFLGLFLAIPTLGAFGILRTLVDRHTTRAAIVSEELLGLMRPSSEGKTASVAPAPPTTPPRPQTVR